MKRIKQILIGVFISILLIPMITNNVYAKTVTLTWQGAGATMNTIKYAKVYDVDFSMINSANITCSMSSPGDTGMSGYAIFKACSTTGDVLTSKRLDLTTNNGSANGSITLNLSSITGQGYFECEYKGRYFSSSGWDYNGPFSISNITAQYIDKPLFKGDLASGNLTHILGKIGSAAVLKCLYCV